MVFYTLPKLFSNDSLVQNHLCHHSFLREEIRSLERELDESKNKLSNPEKVISRALEICSNLSELWVSGGYREKVQLQNLMFPEGILYDRRNDNYRTDKVNLILELTHSFSTSFKQNKNGQTKNNFDLSGLVEGVGI